MSCSILDAERMGGKTEYKPNATPGRRSTCREKLSLVLPRWFAQFIGLYSINTQSKKDQAQTPARLLPSVDAAARTRYECTVLWVHTYGSCRNNH